ncbi:hypothetical protein HMN09_00778400 [Mycena chlorophos]|uniref:Uncharacterized protein n=1 Tax=Mycena chlorophos TaxID=658473 RepID=A0A8H6WAH1_MYCCL|nr:hypothetical protein HMN09_00778400 [Mycena chlorophos]
MGQFDLYCSFCAGPLDNAYEAWHAFLGDQDDSWPPRDGGWRINPPGFAIPTKAKSDIVRITPEDGKYWDDWVSVGPLWEPTWVSPRCEHDQRGEVFIDGSSDWQFLQGQPHFFIIHRGCLSFACRRLNITPQELWESFYKPGADYLRYGEHFDGLKYALEYYNMKDRNQQFFGYAIQRQAAGKDADGTTIGIYWEDPDTMEDCVWLLTRPHCLPMPSLPPPTDPPPSSADEPPCMKVFGISELLQIVLFALLDTGNVEDDRALLALCAVNRFFHYELTQTHQIVFLRLVAEYGWMLPCTPTDWVEWGVTTLDPRRDWRGFLLACLRKQEPFLRNRERMHRMTRQCANGRKSLPTETTEIWRWSVGRLRPSMLHPPETWSWEETA